MTEIAVVTWNFRSDPVALQAAFRTEDRIRDMIAAKIKPEGFVTIRTCNRLEYYFMGYDGISFSSLPDGYSYLRGRNAIEHLLLVVSGLDSLSIGENEILAQVKAAYRESTVVYHLDKVLQQVFRMAISAGKIVRTRTGISRGRTSIAHISVDMLRERGYLDNKKVLLIGTGKISTKILNYLSEDRGIQTTLMGRNISAGEKMAMDHGISFLDLSYLNAKINEFDVVITATSSMNYLITKDTLSGLSHGIVFMDVSNPDNIDPEVRQVSGVTLFNFEDLDSIISASTERKREEIVKAGNIVADQLRIICDSLKEREMDDILETYTSYSQRLSEKEAEKALAALKRGEDPAEVLAAMGSSISKKILRPYIMAVKEAAKSPDDPESNSLRAVVSKIGKTQP